MIYLIIAIALVLLIKGFISLNKVNKKYWTAMEEFANRAQVIPNISDLVLLKAEIQHFYEKESFHRCHYSAASEIVAFINGKISGIQKGD